MCILRLGLFLVSLMVACSPSSGSMVIGGSDAGSGFDAIVPPVGTDAGVVTPPSDPSSCGSTAGADVDLDGYPNGSDCNDCSAQINPGAFDTPGNGIDEDCNGIDDTGSCDVGLQLASTLANDAAMSIGLCKFVAETDSGWGVLSAHFTNASGSGSPASLQQLGLLPSFGTVSPLEGASLFALSSGVARDPSQPGFTSGCDYFGLDGGPFGPPPAGEAAPPVSVSSPSCPGGFGSTQIYNSVALELRIRAPSNATGFSFNSNFFTYEYPEFICDQYNDYFAAMRQTAAGVWENIVFDTEGNAVSVNNSLLQVCTPGTHGGKTFTCPQGRTMLTSTGYDGTAQCGMDPDAFPGSGEPAGAATGWLRTVAPVTGGEVFTLRFAIWDTGDPDLDSLALIDAFEWQVGEVVVPPTPMTAPLI